MSSLTDTILSGKGDAAPVQDAPKATAPTSATSAPNKAPSIGEQLANVLKDPGGFAKAVFMQPGDKPFDPAAAYKTSFQPELSAAREAFVAPAATVERVLPKGMRPIGRLESALQPDVSTPGSKAGAALGMIEGLGAKGGAKGVSMLAKLIPDAAKATKVAKAAVPIAKAAVAGGLQTGGQGDIGTNAALSGATHGLLRAAAPAVSKLVSSRSTPAMSKVLQEQLKTQPGETKAAIAALKDARAKGVNKPAMAAYLPSQGKAQLQQAMKGVGGSKFRQVVTQKISDTAKDMSNYVANTLSKTPKTGTELISDLDTAKKAAADKMYPLAYDGKVTPTSGFIDVLGNRQVPAQVDKAIGGARGDYEKAMIPHLERLKAASHMLAEVDALPPSPAKNKMYTSALKQLGTVPSGAYQMLGKYAALQVGPEVTMNKAIFEDLRRESKAVANQYEPMAKANASYATFENQEKAVKQGAEWFTSLPKSERGEAVEKVASDVAKDIRALTPAEKQLARESYLKHVQATLSHPQGSALSDLQSAMKSGHLEAVNKEILGAKDAKILTDHVNAALQHQEGLAKVAGMEDKVAAKKKNPLVKAGEHGIRMATGIFPHHQAVQAVEAITEEMRHPNLLKDNRVKLDFQKLMSEGSVRDVLKAYKTALGDRRLDKQAARKVSKWLEDRAAQTGAATPKVRNQEQ